jgi:hypothetical protein
VVAVVEHAAGAALSESLDDFDDLDDFVEGADEPVLAAVGLAPPDEQATSRASVPRRAKRRRIAS